MIITRSPLRITLGGGGTDLPSYYREHGGFLIAAAIDKYVYVTVMRPFTPGIYLKYSQLEHVEHDRRGPASDHPRGAPDARLQDAAGRDHDAGGHSRRHRARVVGSFTTALLKALYAHRMRQIHPQELAELACHIEIDRLGEPIGKQDQYIAAYGGMTCFTFHPDDTRRCRAAEDIDGYAVRSRRQSAAVLHRLFAQRRVDPEGSEHQDQEQRRGHDRQPALRQGTRAAAARRCSRPARRPSSAR